MIEIQALELYGQKAGEERDAEAARDEVNRQARDMVDAARLALAQLAGPAVAVLACRLMGETHDPRGREITDEREKAALTVLDRVGVPKLRATAVAASIVASPTHAAPIYGAYGKIEDGADVSSSPLEVDPASVDAQIAAFMEGARVARDLHGE